MNWISIFFIFLSTTLYIASTTQAQNSRTHGLVYQNPMALSPSAYQFFHPNSPSPSTDKPCHSSSRAPVSSTFAEAQATQVHETNASQVRSGNGIGAGGVTGIVFGFMFAVLLGMGVYFLATTRRVNVGKANAIGPDKPDIV